MTAPFGQPGEAVAATDSPEAVFDDARLAWDAGEYVQALEGFLAVLEGEYSDDLFDQIALITGELYRTVDIAKDGRNLRFSPDGRLVAYDHDGYTHIVDVSGEGPERVDRFEGASFAFAPDGQHGVYLKTEEPAEMDDLAERFQEAADAGDRGAMRQIQAELEWLMAQHTTLVHRSLGSGDEEQVPYDDGLLVAEPVFDAETGRLYVLATSEEQTDRTHIYYTDDPGSSLQLLHEDAPGYRSSVQPVHGTTRVLWQMDDESPFSIPRDYQMDDEESVAQAGQIAVFDAQEGSVHTFAGQQPALAAGGSQLAYIRNHDDQSTLNLRSVSDPAEPTVLFESSSTLRSPAVSPDGAYVAFNKQPNITWQVYLADVASGEVEQFSRDIQHELFPQFLNDDMLLAMMGEFRHRRSHVYDIHRGDSHRLFHNNTVRTVSMEYEWAPSADGERLLIRAERDGNTISEEEGVYLVDRSQKISVDELKNRVEQQLRSERDLRVMAERIYAPIREDVQEAVGEINLTRLYEYQKALYDFDSKFYTEPGNRKASAYIYETLQSFGYEPEKQWFMPNDRDSTANVIARLEGSEHPEVVYVYSAHFDSVLGSPGADDNTTGTAVLLEMARVLKQQELPATIIFASLTAEEAGLLGAREFVRRADAEGIQVAGVVNNDMMGWTRHHRFDNTIRFSNYGIRDIQHSSALLFSDLITYDSRYYRFTDAHVFFEAYGDVIGGIGSYPILGNPNYHQPTDRLEVIDHRLVRAVTQATTGVFMKLAQTPSMVRGLSVSQAGDGVQVSWDEAPESDIAYYQVQYRTADGEKAMLESTDRDVVLPSGASGVAVRAVNDRGLHGWDWTHAE